MTQFPWLMCAVLGCMLSQGGKTREWREPKPPSTFLSGYSVVVMRPCVEEIPPFPMTEKVESRIEYELK